MSGVCVSGSPSSVSTGGIGSGSPSCSIPPVSCVLPCSVPLIILPAKSASNTFSDAEASIICPKPIISASSSAIVCLLSKSLFTVFIGLPLLCPFGINPYCSSSQLTTIRRLPAPTGVHVTRDKFRPSAPL